MKIHPSPSKMQKQTNKTQQDHTLKDNPQENQEVAYGRTSLNNSETKWNSEEQSTALY